ncbi:hypothetical protein WME94_40165 [Sorangium sp. So ce429]
MIESTVELVGIDVAKLVVKLEETEFFDIDASGVHDALRCPERRSPLLRCGSSFSPALPRGDSAPPHRSVHRRTRTKIDQEIIKTDERRHSWSDNGLR